MNPIALTCQTMRLLIASILCLAFAITTPAQTSPRAGGLLKEPDDWFRGEEGRRITDNVLSWQSSAGSWPKNKSTTRAPYTGDASTLKGTFDNGATTDEIRFLARAFRATKDSRCEQAVLKGVDHILAAQYPTGGWPQYSPPPPTSYHRHITFNDGSMIRVLELLRDVASAPEFSFVDTTRRVAARQAFDRGVACILKCQITVNGKLTVWCAQHDEKDLSPRPARSYELVSLSGAESAGILRFLMSLERPSPEIIRAIQAGAEWFASAKINGLRQTRDGRNKIMLADTNAPPLWARFYEIETGRPLFSGRDGVPKYRFDEIEVERRNGYAWYGSWGEPVAADYAKWSRRWLKPASAAP
ncbi:MAG TPA: pectate lyase [Verrucomicrobiae bacterium]